MQRKNAKEILVDSFREIAGKKSIDKITINDIVANCGYSPATFYRNFGDKYDLIAWEHTRGVAEIMTGADAESCKWSRILLDAANWFYGEKEYLKNLLMNTKGYDSFLRNMVEIHYTALGKYVFPDGGNSETNIKDKMLVRTYCLGTVGLVCEWILGEYDATPEEIASVCGDAFPQPLKKYLI
ncbi:MAG: TetR/AcrR family transcriptional regulator [Clostridia bacterium]|nr:TetR/AcrR family transcriptional regulator [Clostridia bacterium]